MKFKKLASLLVVAAMMFAMAVPAFAWGGNADPTPEPTAEPTEAPVADPTAEPTEAPQSDKAATSRSVDFKGTTKIPTISVDVATSMDIILNPYGLTVEQDGEEVTDQLISSTLIMTNESDCAIDVSGTITATVAGEAKLVKVSSSISAIGAAETDKNVIVGMVIGNVGAEDAVIDWATAGSTVVAGAAANATPANTSVSSFSGMETPANTNNYHTGWYLFETSGTAKNFGDKKDPNTGDGSATGVPYQLAAGNEEATYLGFRVFGNASQSVKTPWTSADTVSVGMTLTLVPRAVPAST